MRLIILFMKISRIFPLAHLQVILDNNVGIEKYSPEVRLPSRA